MRDFKIINRITNTDDNINRYLNEISKYKILSPEKEAELALKIQQGDEKAKELVLKSNLRFVVSVAKAYGSANVPLGDLISEGNKGLVEAIENFDPTTGFKFISYAVWHIRKNIFKYLNNYSRSIRLPINVNKEMRMYQSLHETFVSYNGREPSFEEMMDIIDNSGGEITISNNTIETIKNNPISVPLESYGGDSSEDFSPISWLESDSESPEGFVLNEDISRTILDLLSELKPMEREVTMMRYGIGKYKEPLSYKNIGEMLERTPEWARGISKKAERKMGIIIRRRKIKGLFF